VLTRNNDNRRIYDRAQRHASDGVPDSFFFFFFFTTLGKLRHVRVALAVGRTRGVLTLPRLGYERRGKRDVALIYGAEFSEGHGRATP